MRPLSIRKKIKVLIQFILITFLTTFLHGCNGQTKSNSPKQNTNAIVGGGCDGCEIMFIGMPENIAAVDTSVGWKENGQKLLITGKVYKIDSKTAMPGVIIYYWQTDNNGYYSPTTGMDEKAKRHGHIRGWVKTDQAGNYAIYTIKPKPYPNASIPAHIHISIKEPDIANEYYIDEFVFNNDKLLTVNERKALENRGGSGILDLSTKGDLEVAKHDIILGLNIPNYPKPKNN